MQLFEQNTKDEQLSLVWFKTLIKETFPAVKFKGNAHCLGLRDRELVSHLREIFESHEYQVLVNTHEILTATKKCGEGLPKDEGNDLFLKVTVDKRTGNFISSSSW